MKTKLALVSTVLVLLLASCQKDPFENSIYSEQPIIGLYQNYLSQNSNLPTDGSEAILKLGKEKGIIEKWGLQFKDSDGDGELDSYEDWRLPVRESANDLVSQMSNEEKIGLLNYKGNIFNKYDEGYAIPGLDFMGNIEEGSVAEGIIQGYRHSNTNITMDPMDAVKFYNNVQGAVERLPYGIPHLFTMEPWHDIYYSNELTSAQTSLWPYYMGLGSIDDLGQTKKFAKILREELRMSGRHGLFGPMAELATEPRWARVQHSFHANSDIVASHIEVFIKALQGYDLDKNDIGVNGALAVLKHFPGNGATEEGMDNHSYSGRYAVYPGDKYEEHLKPFVRAIQNAKPAGIMTSYSIYDLDGFEQVATAFNKGIITDLLRGELGYDGAIITDNGILTKRAYGYGMPEQNYEATPERVADMIDAGVTQYLPGDEHDAFMQAIEQGLISQEQIDNAAMHSLELQLEIGLFENPYTDVQSAEKFWDPNGKEMQYRVEAGKDAMRKAMVLAKNNTVGGNDTELLPIKGGNFDYIDAVDINGNGTVDVYFDSFFDESDSGQTKSYAVSTDESYKNINFVSNIEDADIAIARFFARGGTYFGSQGAVPLDYETSTRVWDRENQVYTDEEVPLYTGGFPRGEHAIATYSDWSNVGGSVLHGTAYRSYLGYKDSKAILDRLLAAKVKNPNLKIVAGITLPRPAIVAPFLEQLDGLFFDFIATDSAFLDVVFWQNGAKPQGRLPVEIPADNESANAQLEDVPNDSENATFEVGYGLEYVTLGGYGN